LEPGGLPPALSLRGCTRGIRMRLCPLFELLSLSTAPEERFERRYDRPVLDSDVA
jgi:hypothetical protein